MSPRTLISGRVAPLTWVVLLLVASAPAPPALAQHGGMGKPPLVPWPASVTRDDGAFPLGGELLVAGLLDETLRGASERLERRWVALTGTEMVLEPSDDPRRASFVIDCAGPLLGELPSLEDDESYRLRVTSERIHLEAPGPLGVLRGFATLAQLPARGGDGWVLPAVDIADAPRFPWRGLMIDVVRHWQPIDVIERNLDAMEAVKLNVLHLHLTDDQGFRVESRTHPLLHERGSGGPYLSSEDVGRLVAYAAARGIRVVPELDVPGHATSWLLGYPEIGPRSGEPPEELPGVSGIFHNALDPTRDETYEFLDGLFGDMARLFPDRYLHVGGDEVTARSWEKDEAIQAFMARHGLDDTHALQAYFTDRVLGLVESHGKAGIGWDEIARGDVPPETVIQVWLPGANPGDARSLVSSGFYLDHMLHAGQHYANEPLDRLPTEEARAGLLGGEACVWTEAITSETIDSRIWPRTAAIAERLWSPRELRDVPDMYRRLSAIRSDLARMGLRHHSYYIPALARLTDGTLDAPLKILADVSEPPSVVGRMLSPEVFIGLLAPGLAEWLVEPAEVGTRFEHVLHPESEEGRAFSRRVADFLESPESAEARRLVEDRLHLWHENHYELKPLLAKHPSLQEIEPVSAALSELAGLGLSALEVLDGERLFTAREKRIQEERLALRERLVVDLGALDVGPETDLGELVPGLVLRMVTDRLKTFEPLITFRVSVAIQPGVEALVRAAHKKGTRHEGVLARGAFFLYDHRRVFVTALLLGALIVWIVRRRRRRAA